MPSVDRLSHLEGVELVTHVTYSHSFSRKIPGPLPKRGWLGKAQAFWLRCSKKTRVAALTVIVSIPLLGLLWQDHSSRTSPLNLFPYPLTAPQSQEVSQVLSTWSVGHTVNSNQDNLLVAPEERAGLLVRLGMKGLPHRESKAEAPGLGGGNTHEIQARLNHQLEHTLEECIRTIGGVRDARVTLALSEKMFDDGPSTSASVFLTMQSEQQLSPEQASGVAHMVAAAVPGLEDDRVSLVDNTGKALPRKHASANGGLGEFQIELQKQLDNYLAGKAQTLLDSTYGPGRGAVIVNAEFDFSQMEVRRTSVGKPGSGETVVVEQKTDEHYKKQQTQTASGSQIIDEEEAERAGVPSGGEGSNYNKVCEARRFKNDEAMTFTVFKIPRVRRITAAVSINLKGQEANIKNLMLGALGIDESRGDFLGVATVPGPGPTLAAPVSPTAPLAAVTQPVSPLWVASLILPGLALIGLWALRRENSVGQALVHCQSGADLCDSRLSSRGVHTVDSPETGVSAQCRLEEMAREKPAHISDRLRTLINTELD